MRSSGLSAGAAALVCLAVGAGPAQAEAVPVDQAVTQLDAICSASRAAFMSQGGTVRIGARPSGPEQQIQKFDPISERVYESAWPAVVVRGRGTLDRSGAVVDARLTRAQIRQATKYLGFRDRPWVVERGDYGVLARESYADFLRYDLFAPDRFIDLDSAYVPSWASHCADHLLDDRDAHVERTAVAGGTRWVLDYEVVGENDIQNVHTEFTVSAEGRLSDGWLTLRAGSSRQSQTRVSAQWTYQRPVISLPPKAKVVSTRAWTKATDAAAMITDLRYLARQLEGRRSVSTLRTQARQMARSSNIGHVVKFKVSNVDGGVWLRARNPYSGQRVVFSVTVQSVPSSVARRVR